MFIINQNEEDAVLEDNDSGETEEIEEDGNESETLIPELPDEEFTEEEI